jgi:hypothetical protein
MHCTAIVHVHSIATRHHIVADMPDEAQHSSILCCRIMSGMSIIDPLQPSVSLIWYFVIRKTRLIVIGRYLTCRMVSPLTLANHGWWSNSIQ